MKGVTATYERAVQMQMDGKQATANKGFRRDQLHSFDPATKVIKSTCLGCDFWMTANSIDDLTRKEKVHAASCTKALLTQ